MVVWDSDGGSGSDTSGRSVQGQRYEGPQCVTASDCDDANVCTADACVGGECTNTAVPCDEPPCVTASDCDDGNVCTADACVGGECRETNTAAPCDDGSVCTTGEVCGDGACLPGVPLDVAAVARGVTGATETPAPCTTGKKDPQRARHVLKQLKAARKWLGKGAKATKPSKREKLIGKAARRSAKARAVLARFAATLSPVCHAALLGQLIQAQEQIDCL